MEKITHLPSYGADVVTSYVLFKNNFIQYFVFVFVCQFRRSSATTSKQPVFMRNTLALSMDLLDVDNIL